MGNNAPGFFAFAFILLFLLFLGFQLHEHREQQQFMAGYGMCYAKAYGTNSKEWIPCNAMPSVGGTYR